MALVTTSNLVSKVESYIGDTTSVLQSSTLDFVDRAHKAIVAGGGELNDKEQRPVIFSWARAAYPKTIVLSTKETGTLAATEDSNSVTFSAAPSQNLLDWHIKINNEDPIYRISAHSGVSTSATLDSTFINANGSALSFTAFKLVYTVGASDILIPLGPIRSHVRTDSRIDIVSESTMIKQYPLMDVRESNPKMAAIIAASSGNITLLFNSYPSEKRRVDLPYIPIPATLDLVGSNPIVPVDHRLLIAELAASFMASQVDDDRSKMFFDRARQQFRALVRAERQVTEAGSDLYGTIDLEPTEDGILLRTASGDYVNW